MRKEDILLYPFKYRYYLGRGTNPCPVRHTIESHSILDKYLYADISTPIIEIPLIFTDALRLALKFPTGECAQIVAPLVYGREVSASTTYLFLEKLSYILMLGIINLLKLLLKQEKNIM